MSINVKDVINRIPNLKEIGIKLKQMMIDKIIEQKQYIDKYGIDMPEILNWK